MVQYTASLNHGCFGTITKMLDRKVDKSRTYSIAYKKRQRRVLCYTGQALRCWERIWAITAVISSIRLCIVSHGLTYYMVIKGLHQNTHLHSHQCLPPLDHCCTGGRETKDVTRKEYCIDLAKEMLM
eukprot:1970233-Ditylum_brightwellii.AAC.1